MCFCSQLQTNSYPSDSKAAGFHKQPYAGLKTVPIKLVERRDGSSPRQEGHCLSLLLAELLAAFHKIMVISLLFAFGWFLES